MEGKGGRIHERVVGEEEEKGMGRKEGREEEGNGRTNNPLL